MKLNDLDSEIKERLRHIYWSFYLYNKSLTELYTVTFEKYNLSELKIINSSTFNFYKVTLQYCFIMEYCKLLEPKKKSKRQENITSLEQLNELLLTEYPKRFEKEYRKNNLLVQELQQSDFNFHIRALRDKKFAHSDLNNINQPYEIKGLKEDEINEGFQHLRLIRNIIENFTSISHFEYEMEIPYRGSQTENFVKFHADYRDFYFENNL